MTNSIHPDKVKEVTKTVNLKVPANGKEVSFTTEELIRKAQEQEMNKQKAAFLDMLETAKKHGYQGIKVNPSYNLELVALPKEKKE